MMHRNTWRWARIGMGIVALCTAACSDGVDDSGSGGGSSSGGTASGGTASGGTASGGTASGGTGGTTSGGASTGGTTSGGTGGGTGPFPDSEIGKPCAGDGDCGTIEGYDLWCKTNWTGGYCTADCGSFGPCDAGSTCKLSVFECHKSCSKETEAEDCRADEGYKCVERDGVWGCED